MTEMPTFFREGFVKARPKPGKKYRCEECRGEISRGTLHYVANGCWDGDVRTFRLHVCCHGLLEQVRDDEAAHGLHDDEMTPFGGLIDALAASDEDYMESVWPKGVRRTTLGLQEWAMSQQDTPQQDAG